MQKIKPIMNSFVGFSLKKHIKLNETSKKCDMFLSKDLKLLTSSMFLHIPCVKEQDAPLALVP